MTKSGQGLIMSPYKYCNDPSGSTKGGEFLEHLVSSGKTLLHEVNLSVILNDGASAWLLECRVTFTSVWK
jgi:hypothetical protein